MQGRIDRMKQIRRYVLDNWNRVGIRVRLLFETDERERVNLWVALGLCSKQGRKLLGDAMVQGVRVAIGAAQ